VPNVVRKFRKTRDDPAALRQERKDVSIERQLSHTTAEMTTDQETGDYRWPVSVRPGNYR